MVKKRLMLGAAFAALSLVPLTTAPAVADDVIDNYDLDIYADWDNDVEVDLEWDVEVHKYLDIRGHISIDGSITADALSQATLDDKQILTGNDISFEDYQNTSQDNSIYAEPNPGGVNDTVEGEPTEAIYSNTINLSASAATTSGNIGINLAAGDYNLQENAAVLSNANGTFAAETENSSHSFSLTGAGGFAKSFDASGAVDVDVTEQVGTVSTQWGFAASGSIAVDFSGSASFSLSGSESSASFRSARESGAAEAGSFSLQSLYNNTFNTNGTPEDGVSGEQSAELENTDIDNIIDITDGTLNAANGNIGLNVAAGAFNIQKNALVIASVAGGHLAEATSGVLQHSEKNDTTIEDVVNNINLSGSLTSASGNIGVNVAAGVGNMQLNTLTIATTLPDLGGGDDGEGD